MVTLFEIDPKTGNQNRLGRRTKVYQAAAGEPVEAVYDEFAAQEANIDGPAEELTLSAPSRPATHRRSDQK